MTEKQNPLLIEKVPLKDEMLGFFSSQAYLKQLKMNIPMAQIMPKLFYRRKPVYKKVHVLS